MLCHSSDVKIVSFRLVWRLINPFTLIVIPDRFDATFHGRGGDYLVHQKERFTSPKACGKRLLTIPTTKKEDGEAGR